MHLQDSGCHISCDVLGSSGVSGLSNIKLLQPGYPAGGDQILTCYLATSCGKISIAE